LPMGVIAPRPVTTTRFSSIVMTGFWLYAPDIMLCKSLRKLLRKSVKVKFGRTAVRPSARF
jgi:hypothetical protein